MIQKKIKSLIYAGIGLVLCVLLCGGIGMTAQAASYGDLTYEENESGITITKYEGNKKKLVIPEKIGGKKVTSIGNYAFGNWSGLKSITLPKGVTSIEEDAFSFCSGLTSITLPKSVTSIGESTGDHSYNAFAGCSSLTSIKVSKENKYYDSRNDCNAIINTKSNTLVSGCKNTVIPDSVTSIEIEAFYGCSGLKSITIPKSVTAIYDEIFPGCDNLVISCYKDSEIYKHAKTNNIPVKLIVDPAKKGTIFAVSSKKLEVVVTSSSKKNPTVTVTKITDKYAKKLTTVTIGSNVTTIGIGAFYGCKNLKKITVTAGKLTTINRSVFKGIKKNATITVKGTKKAKTALKKQLKKKSIGYVKTWKIK